MADTAGKGPTFCTGMGALTAAGGPERLLQQAGASASVPLLAVGGNEVDTIDLTVPTDAAAGGVRSIAIGTSLDGNVYVRGWDTAMYGFLYWGDNANVAGVQDSRTVRLEYTGSHGAAIQNPFTLMSTQYVYGGTEQVVVFVPEGWEGDIVCSNETGTTLTSIRTGAFTRDALGWEGDYISDGLVVDGDIDIQAGAVSLALATVNAVDVMASNVSLYGLSADELNANVGQTYGRTSVYGTEVAGTASFGGSQVEVDGLTAESVELDERTHLVEEGAL